MIALATEMGCLICSKHATEPHIPLWSIMQASKVSRPSRSKLPLYPTDVTEGSASVTLTPSSTASNAEPFCSNIFMALSLADIPNGQVDITLIPESEPELVMLCFLDSFFVD